MATYSLLEAQQLLPSLLERAAQGEEVLIAAGVNRTVSLQPVKRSRGPMSPERLAWLDSVRVTPLPGSPSGPELVRAMRDEGY